MKKGAKVTLAVLVAVGLTAGALGGVALAAGPDDASGICPASCDRQEWCERDFCGQNEDCHLECTLEKTQQRPGLHASTREQMEQRLQCMEQANCRMADQEQMEQRLQYRERANCQVADQEQVEQRLQCREQANCRMANCTNVNSCGPSAEGNGNSWG